MNELIQLWSKPALLEGRIRSIPSLRGTLKCPDSVDWHGSKRQPLYVCVLGDSTWTLIRRLNEVEAHVMTSMQLLQEGCGILRFHVSKESEWGSAGILGSDVPICVGRPNHWFK